jgi:hypothetical protein
MEVKIENAVHDIANPTYNADENVKNGGGDQVQNTGEQQLITSLPTSSLPNSPVDTVGDRIEHSKLLGERVSEKIDGNVPQGEKLNSTSPSPKSGEIKPELSAAEPTKLSHSPKSGEIKPELSTAEPTKSSHSQKSGEARPKLRIIEPVKSSPSPKNEIKTPNSEEEILKLQLEINEIREETKKLKAENEKISLSLKELEAERNELENAISEEILTSLKEIEAERIGIEKIITSRT